MNLYLKGLRERYDSLKASISGLQERAAEENRDLSTEELRSVEEMSNQAKGLYTQIESLTEVEERNQKVAALNTRLDVSKEEERSATGTPSTPVAYTQDRDPGHYRQGGEHSFFGDLLRSKYDDSAARRLHEHARALDTANEGPGVVPPQWLASEFETANRQGRALANAVRRIQLTNPSPLSLPRQSAGVSGSSVAEQTNENDPLANVDEWDSAVTTVTPKPTAGKQVVSRQMMDMSNPAIDSLIYGDLLAEYDRQVESKVGSALITAAGAATVTFATESAFNVDNEVFVDSVVDLSIAVRDARKLPPNLLVMRTRRWGDVKKLKDSQGRPLFPNGGYGPRNVFGVGSVLTDGEIEGLAVVVSEAVGTTAYPESYLALRADDCLLFESPVLRFRFEEKSGPESIELGVWAYSAVHVKYSGDGVARAEITAA